MYQLFLKHPHSIGESYLQHMATALHFGAVMVVSGVACMIHAIVPALFEKTASNTVARLYARMTNRRRTISIELDYAI